MEVAQQNKKKQMNFFHIEEYFPSIILIIVQIYYLFLAMILTIEVKIMKFVVPVNIFYIFYINIFNYTLHAVHVYWYAR